VVREGPADPSLIKTDESDVCERAVSEARDYAGHGLFVGIVCPDSCRREVESELNRHHVQWADAGDGGLTKSLNLVRPAEAKGLEFDAVVVVEPEAIVAETDHGLRMLYVALTRTTRFLSVIHSGKAMPIPMPGESDPAPGDVEVILRSIDEPPTEPVVSTVLSAVPTVQRAAAAGVPDALVRAVASEITSQIRATLQPHLWSAVMDELQRQLSSDGGD
jgi:hypothetical protein